MSRSLIALRVGMVAAVATLIVVGVFLIARHPPEKPGPYAMSRPTIVIAVERDGTITWNGQIVTWDEMLARLKQAAPKPPAQE